MFGEKYDKDEIVFVFEGLFFNYFSVGKFNIFISIFLWNLWVLRELFIMKF